MHVCKKVKKNKIFLGSLLIIEVKLYRYFTFHISVVYSKFLYHYLIKNAHFDSESDA